MQAKLILCQNPNQAIDFLKENEGLETENNPDLLIINSERISIKIAQIRALTQEVLYAPTKSKIKYVVVYDFDQATIPAQNAFLKSLEEPPSFVAYVLLASSTANILPTIRSRCVTINLRTTSNLESNQAEVEDIFKKISNASYSEKIDLAGQYKDRADAKNLLKSLIHLSHHQNQNFPSSSSTRNLQILTKYLRALDQNINVNLALEQCFFQLNPSPANLIGN